jgi:hypothetical protein
MGKSVLINDQDCDIELPCPIDDNSISQGQPYRDQQASSSPLFATIHVVRSISQLIRILRAISISCAALETFELHFNTCRDTFSAYLQFEQNTDLDPRSLAPIVYLQNARLLLQRHNISPFGQSATRRAAAIENCVSIAIETASILLRCMRSHTGNEDWRFVFASSAGTLLCTHIWRCTLFLLCRRRFAAALICIQASAAVGDNRAGNVACGRHLAFFLRRLLDRSRLGQPGVVDDLERDEEIMAYLTEDMHRAGDSWVWQHIETSESTGNTFWQSIQTLTQSDSQWEGWEWVKNTIEHLPGDRTRRDCKWNNVETDSSLYHYAKQLMGLDTTDCQSSSVDSRMKISSVLEKD